MPKFRVCLVESIEYVFEVEAFNADEAHNLAEDLEAEDAVSQQFFSREHRWTDELKT